MEEGAGRCGPVYLGLAGTPTWAVIAGVSAFGSLPLNATFKGFGRFDVVTHDAEDTTDSLFITGLDYSAATNVHLMPNVLIESSAGRDANVQGRLTFYYKF